MVGNNAREDHSADPSAFVLVNNEDAIEAMAYYLAQCIAAHPEAQRLAPQQLQLALANALQVRAATEMVVHSAASNFSTLSDSCTLLDPFPLLVQGMKQTRLKQICTYGRSAYRWSALTYSALQMYQNPW